MSHRIAAELIGTFVLVFFGVGSAIYGIDDAGIGRLGVALTFGLVLLALAYAFGPVSGCHVNPAVTLGVLLTKGIRGAEAGAFVAAQLVGGILAGGALYLMVHFGGVHDQTGGLGTNGYGTTVQLGGALAIEVVGLDPAFAFAFLVYVLIVVSVGGLGSVGGSFAAAVLLGITDIAGKYYVPEVGAFLIYLMMVVLLMWRPAGLFGRR